MDTTDNNDYDSCGLLCGGGAALLLAGARRSLLAVPTPAVSMESVRSVASAVSGHARGAYDVAATAVSAVNVRLPEGTAKVVLGAAIGAAAIPLVGVAAGALVPSAMSTFGVVVPGVGTLHAAGGAAATLQWTAATYVTTTGAIIGGIAGGTSAAVPVLKSKL